MIQYHRPGLFEIKPGDVVVRIESFSSPFQMGEVFFVNEIDNVGNLSQPELAVELLKLVLVIVMDKFPGIRADYDEKVIEENLREERKNRAKESVPDKGEVNRRPMRLKFNTEIRFDGTPHATAVWYGFRFDRIREIYESIK